MKHRLRLLCVAVLIVAAVATDAILVVNKQSAAALAVSAILLICAAVLILVDLGEHTAEQDEKAVSTDPLTGLPNSQLFERLARKLIETRGQTKYAVIYGDIDSFKFINDIFGYDTGDELLKSFADFVKNGLGKKELACRLSGDTFVFLETYETADDLTRKFSAAADFLADFPKTAAQNYKVLISGGCYLLDTRDEKHTLDEMTDRANLAEKTVKGIHGSQLAFYDEEMRAKVRWEKEVESQMRSALDAGEFLMYLQPQVNVQGDTEVSGAEALVRWSSPEYGLVSPSRFIHVFEQNGFIVELDRFILRKACEFLAENCVGRDRPMTLSVNVSKQDIYRSDFVEYYASVKNEYAIPDGMLELEFTENMIAENRTAFLENVRRLKQAGFRCCMDDFGTRYSSLNIIKDLPMDTIKIDMLYFSVGQYPEREKTVLASIMAMSRAMHMKTVAEGVEEPEQLEFLKSVGCDTVQGYVFSQGVPSVPAEIFKSEMEEISVTAAARTHQARAALPDFLTDLSSGTVLSADLENDSYTVMTDGSAHGSTGKYSDVLFGLLSLIPDARQRASTSDAFSAAGLLAAFFKGEKQIYSEFGILDDIDGGMTWISLSAGKLARNGKYGAIIVIQPSDRRTSPLQKLSNIARQLELIQKQLYRGMFELNLVNGRINWLKEFSEPAMTGLSAFSDFDEAVSVMAEKHIHPDDRGNFLRVSERRRIISLLDAGEKTAYCEYRLRVSDDPETYRWYSTTYLLDNSHGSAGVLGIMQDVHAKKQTEEQLKRRASTDPLTGLLNRASLEQEFAELIVNAPDRPHALMILDLDNLKKINDAYGHPFGDAVLTGIARKLQRSFRSSDLIARIGGDEFMLVLGSIPDAGFAARSAEKIRLAISEPIPHGGELLSFTCSIGVATCPEDGKEFDALYKSADSSLYIAKQNGKNHVCVSGKLL